jgi:hypothetical protein
VRIERKCAGGAGTEESGRRPGLKIHWLTSV